MLSSTKTLSKLLSRRYQLYLLIDLPHPCKRIKLQVNLQKWKNQNLLGGEPCTHCTFYNKTLFSHFYDVQSIIFNLSRSKLKTSGFLPVLSSVRLHKRNCTLEKSCRVVLVVAGGNEVGLLSKIVLITPKTRHAVSRNDYQGKEASGWHNVLKKSIFKTLLLAAFW